MTKQDFLKVYSSVFNEDGSVKLCGREKCKDLIIACIVLSDNNTYFGDRETGMMNIENIQTLKKGLCG